MAGREGAGLAWLPPARLWGAPADVLAAVGSKHPEAGIRARPATSLRPLPVRLQAAWGPQAVGPTAPPGGQESLTVPLPGVTNGYADCASWSAARRRCTSKCHVKN